MHRTDLFSVERSIVLKMLTQIRHPRPLVQPEGIQVVEHRLGRRYRFAKRVLDVIGASVLLVALSPLLAAIALLVRLTSKGPIIYMCKRVGHRGETFRFVKFRTMYVDADQHLDEVAALNEKDGPIFKAKRDPRVTPVGYFLRRASLDELPQLLNVIRGTMSLVGPRPALPHEVVKYDEFAAHRLSVRPGMTCYWQVMGRSDLSFEEWMELDNRYIEDMSFWTDLKILLLTPWAVIRAKGAY